MDPNAQQKLDFNKTLAFKDYTIVRNPSEYEYSNIDATNYRRVGPHAARLFYAG